MSTREWLQRHERKFNPYHDPKNGQFTFGPGGASVGRSGHGASKVTTRNSRAMSQHQVEAHADHAMDQYHRERARGKSPEEAAAWAANSEAESGGDPGKHQIGGGPGRGLFQWGSTISAYDRRRDFEKFASDRNLNVTLDKAPADVQLDFRDWELTNKERAAGSTLTLRCLQQTNRVQSRSGMSDRRIFEVLPRTGLGLRKLSTGERVNEIFEMDADFTCAHMFRCDRYLQCAGFG